MFGNPLLFFICFGEVLLACIVSAFVCFRQCFGELLCEFFVSVFVHDFVNVSVSASVNAPNPPTTSYHARMLLWIALGSFSSGEPVIGSNEMNSNLNFSTHTPL